MIRVHKLDGRELLLNAELVESIEARPDSIITLSTNKKIVVRESLDELEELIVDYRKKVLSESSKGKEKDRSEDVN